MNTEEGLRRSDLETKLEMTNRQVSDRVEKVENTNMLCKILTSLTTKLSTLTTRLATLTTKQP